jgi:hypothetical protein
MCPHGLHGNAIQRLQVGEQLQEAVQLGLDPLLPQLDALEPVLDSLEGRLQFLKPGGKLLALHRQYNYQMRYMEWWVHRIGWVMGG